jgi:hypothetical protein
MNQCKMSVSKVIAAAAMVLLAPSWVCAQSVDDQPYQPMIAKIKDLIADFGESQWTVTTESGSQYGDAIGGVDRAKKTLEKGYFISGRQFVEDDSTKSSVIEINAQPIKDDRIIEIRGSYTLNLPVYKRIQLEIEYELPLVNEITNTDEYYVEIFERNVADKEEWVKTGILKQEEELKSAIPNVLEKRG